MLTKFLYVFGMHAVLGPTRSRSTHETVWGVFGGISKVRILKRGAPSILSRNTRMRDAMER